jgi:hypothetical protein
VIVEFVAEWMQAWYERPDLEFQMPKDWCSEMKAPLPGPWNNPNVRQWRCPKCATMHFDEYDLPRVLCGDCDEPMEELLPLEWRSCSMSESKRYTMSCENAHGEGLGLSADHLSDATTEGEYALAHGFEWCVITDCQNRDRWRLEAGVVTLLPGDTDAGTSRDCG